MEHAAPEIACHVIDPARRAQEGADGSWVDDRAANGQPCGWHKAYSVAAFAGLRTHRWWDLIKAPLLHGIVKTERLVIFLGGVPIQVEGQVVGAVGVSGASSEQDQHIAEAWAASAPG
jgi:uncharacterized protein GlcG (DUF336 family)